MDANSHYEMLKKMCEEGKVQVEERPRQKWGANFKGGAVAYNVLRVGGNRCDFLFDDQGKLVAVSN
ncbi:MAG: hypothetical protein V4498_07000 [candidate division FCPU426 bacterium]